MTARPPESDAVPTYTREGGTPETLAATEWVLTNGLGGFAMGTALGAPTRRYHGMLVAALSPPVQRHLMLHSIADTLIVELGTAREQRTELTPFCFKGGVWTGAGGNGMVRFEKDVSCRWVYRVGSAELTKTLHLVHGRNAAVVTYRLNAGGAPVRLTLRPLVAMRDSHALLQASDPELPRAAGITECGLTMVRGATRLELWAEGALFTADSQPWYGFEYPRERERGFDCLEDLVCPGVFTSDMEGTGETVVSLSAWVGERPGEVAADDADRKGALGRAVSFAGAALKSDTAKGDREALRRLVAAAADFPVRRAERSSDPDAANGGLSGCTIIAGYPWFTDWGRDAMISLPGLLLVTGRHGEALSVLSTLARHCRRGLIPNNFDDHTGEPSYNTVDASLWFLHAACEYLRASGDRAGFDEHLRAACLHVIDEYGAGTDYGIRVDRDGLVMAGDGSTQLTWMDAKRDGVVFTPRHGKPVEINALWHHGLLAVADAISPGDRERAGRFRAAAARAAESFCAQFWNPAKECLYDVLQPAPDGSWRPNDQVRPNQVFAVSLPHSPLDERQQRAVVQTVRARLLTPHGLRTLDPADPAYRGRFAGPIFERDGAYHNGTVWPWLMGPFVEAVLRVGKFSAPARADARELLRPLIERMDRESLGQIAEVFDGDDHPDAPQRPGGCIAQAWSVAEVLRAFVIARGKALE